MGNALIDSETSYRGMCDCFCTLALISDVVHQGITSSCNFSSPKSSEDCDYYDGEVGKHLSNVDIYNITPDNLCIDIVFVFFFVSYHI